VSRAKRALLPSPHLYPVYGFLVLFPEHSKFRTAKLPGFLFYFSQVTFLLLNVFSP
jgi:hypothetical protein